MFEDIQLFDSVYEVQIEAKSLGGENTETAILSLHDVLAEATGKYYKRWQTLSIIALLFYSKYLVRVLQTRSHFSDTNKNKNQTLKIVVYLGVSIIAVIVVLVSIATFIHLKARSRRRRYREEYFEVS